MSARPWPARDYWEAAQIREALATAGGNLKLAAQLLGVRRTTLFQRRRTLATVGLDVGVARTAKGCRR